MQPDEQQKPPANPQGVSQPVSPVVPGSTGIARERDNIRPTAGGPEVAPDLKRIGVKDNPDLEGVPPMSLGTQIQSNQRAVISLATSVSTVQKQEPQAVEKKPESDKIISFDKAEAIVNARKHSVIPPVRFKDEEFLAGTEVKAADWEKEKNKRENKEGIAA